MSAAPPATPSSEVGDPGARPLIPSEAELASPMAFPRAINEMFQTVRSPGTVKPNLLESAHAAGGEKVDEWRPYNGDEALWLNNFVRLLQDCRWVDAYAARPDGGGMCEEPPDAGMPPMPDAGDEDGGAGDDAGDMDAGMMDATSPRDASSGMSSGGMCECPLPPRDLSHCVGSP